MSVAIIDSSNKLPQAEKKKARNCCETESAIKTKSVLCLEVSKTMKSNQEILLYVEFLSENKVVTHEYANYLSPTLTLC